jgi:hypothetical protein
MVFPTPPNHNLFETNDRYDRNANHVFSQRKWLFFSWKYSTAAMAFPSLGSGNGISSKHQKTEKTKKGYHH